MKIRVAEEGKRLLDKLSPTNLRNSWTQMDKTDRRIMVASNLSAAAMGFLGGIGLPQSPLRQAAFYSPAIACQTVYLGGREIPKLFPASNVAKLIVSLKRDQVEASPVTRTENYSSWWVPVRFAFKEAAKGISGFYISYQIGSLAGSIVKAINFT